MEHATRRRNKCLFFEEICRAFERYLIVGTEGVAIANQTIEPKEQIKYKEREYEEG